MLAPCMEERRRQYDLFLRLHAHKARSTEEPTAHVCFYRGGDGVPAAASLVAMRREDVLQELDGEAELVRWLLNQMSTYDCRTQAIVALVFDDRTVLSDVLWRR
jgi:hypothetical protein